MSAVGGRSGAWLGLVLPHAWAVVDLPDGDPRTPELRAALAAADLSAALDVLTRSGVSATPHFAMASSQNGQVRYLVRGAATVQLAGPGGGQEVSGSGSSTWVDAFAGAEVATVRLTAPSAGADVPVGEVGRLGGISVDLVAPTPAAAAPPPPPAVSPVAEAPANSYESVFFDLLTANTTTRDALVQSLTEAQAEDDAPAPSPVPLQPPSSEAPVRGETATWEGTSSWLPAPPVVPVSAPPTAPPPPTGAIIEALPWETPSTPLPPAPAPYVPPAAPQAATPPPPYVPPAAPQAATPPPPPPPAPVPDQVAENPDATRRRADLIAALREPTPAGPTVLAVVCPNRHWSPPYAPNCRVCGAAVMEQQPQRIPRPSLGRLTVSTGATVTLDKGVIFGRLPQTTAEGAARPNLIKLDGAEISRQHVEVRLEDWQVLVRDLGSGNGTTITLPGRPAELIRPRIDYTLEPGTIIGIADVVTVTYEATA